jgi:glycosyltransferase involved in cell wall biosynthesis
MAAPEIALIVSTYEKPTHLARVLCSIGCQQEVDGLFEVVVTDDGSTDETSDVVERFAAANTSTGRLLLNCARCANWMSNTATTFTPKPLCAQSAGYTRNANLERAGLDMVDWFHLRSRS